MNEDRTRTHESRGLARRSAQATPAAPTARRMAGPSPTPRWAKGLLMDHLGLSEAAAFRLLQKSAMDRRVAIVALAERLIAGEDLAAMLVRR